MEKQTHRVFETPTGVKLRVTRPTPNQTRKAQIEYNSAFAELVNREKPALLREALEDVSRKQGLWNDEKENEYRKLVKELNDSELKLAKGGIKKSEARAIALNMRKLRRQIAQARSAITNLDNYTAQGQADNHSFNFLVAECTVYDEDNKKYFKNLDDYLERSSDEVSIQAASELMSLMYGFDNDFEKKLPENQFLLKFGYVDDKLRLINSEGKLIDEKDRLVNENYNLIDADGNLIDEEGNRISEAGEYLVEQSPFLEEDGTPIQDS